MKDPSRWDVFTNRIECYRRTQCTGNLNNTPHCACWWYGHFKVIDLIERYVHHALAFAIGFTVAYIIFG